MLTVLTFGLTIILLAFVILSPFEAARKSQKNKEEKTS